MAYTINGEIKEIKETQTFGANGFRKREMILIAGDRMYPQYLKIEFLQDKVDLLDEYKEGDGVKVSFELRGREWQNDKEETIYFNSINGWKIEKLSEGEKSKNKDDKPAKTENPPSTDEGNEDDDLPF